MNGAFWICFQASVGLSLGLERAGMQTVAFCEVNPYCRTVLARHWPGVPIHDDVRELKGADVENITIICGGFPCQDISTAGSGKGLVEGTRSGLWSEYARLIGEISTGLRTRGECSGATFGGQWAAGSQRSSQTWPSAGTMRNGSVYRLPSLAHRTSGTESSYWPTALATDRLKLERSSNKQLSSWRHTVAGHAIQIVHYLIAANYSPSQMVTFLEAFMGFPTNWTASKRSGTRSSRKSPKSSGGRS